MKKQLRTELSKYTKWLFSRRPESPSDAAIMSEIDTYLLNYEPNVGDRVVSENVASNRLKEKIAETANSK